MLQNAPAAPFKDDAARVQFIKYFKEVQRLLVRLGQYTDLSAEEKARIARIAPPDRLHRYRALYLETAKYLLERQQDQDAPAAIKELDFEFELFCNPKIDYDYIMVQIAKLTQGDPSVTRESLAVLVATDAKFLMRRDDLLDFIANVPTHTPLSEEDVKAAYAQFKEERKRRVIDEIAERHGIEAQALHDFIDDVLRRRVFDAQRLTELLAPKGWGWKDRMQAEARLLDDLVALLRRLAPLQKFSGLSAFEN